MLDHKAEWTDQIKIQSFDLNLMEFIYQKKKILVWFHGSGGLYFTREAANTVLVRRRRFNSGHLEEMLKDNLERECIEELCNMEEAREWFEDDEKTVSGAKKMTSVPSSVSPAPQPVCVCPDCSWSSGPDTRVRSTPVGLTALKQKPAASVCLYADGDQCKPLPCLNGGECKDGINSYVCWCKLGFSGKNCEIGEFLKEKNSV